MIALAQTIVELARGASIEINVQDAKHLDASREFLAPGTKMYVSHLPKQRWADTIATCKAVRAAGFNPVPHIPARLLPDAQTLHFLIEELTSQAGVQEILLIAGDYSEISGPYPCVAQVLRTYPFAERGIKQVSLAGHPEGHPKVSLEVIREAEREKFAIAACTGLEVTLLTQFFFEAEPFLHWTQELQMHGVGARMVGGIAGPANAATLFKFALRCGVGPSMRALVMRPGSAMKLTGDHGPEWLMCDLAIARQHGVAEFGGIHVFCFGGYLRTCKWLRALANGWLEWLESGGFRVRT